MNSFGLLKSPGPVWFILTFFLMASVFYYSSCPFVSSAGKSCRRSWAVVGDVITQHWYPLRFGSWRMKSELKNNYPLRTMMIFLMVIHVAFPWEKGSGIGQDRPSERRWTFEWIKRRWGSHPFLSEYYCYDCLSAIHTLISASALGQLSKYSFPWWGVVWLFEVTDMGL